MSTSPRDSYLETEVFTAPPQKRQLMLIDGAIRSAERARQQWQAGDSEAAVESLIRAQQIVTAMLGGLNHELGADLTRRVAGVYLFVYRQLLEANLQQSEEKLDEGLRVLRIERETWRLLCEQMGTDVECAPPAADPQTAGPPDLWTGADLQGGASAGLSLDA